MKRPKLDFLGNVSNIVEMCNDMQMLKNSSGPNVISARLEELSLAYRENCYYFVVMVSSTV